MTQKSLHSNDLSEFSSSYYQNADIYKLFSEAEDKENYIFEFLKPYLTNKKVLDLGCGNGRHLELINSISSFSMGVDQSLEQIKQSNKGLPFVVGDGSNLPFSNEFFDCTISFWVWGTILDEHKREAVLQEAKRITKKGGSIFLVENDNPSEFEHLRGRHLNSKTIDYNNWILDNNFSILKKLETFITFENSSLAQHVFSSIWQDRLFQLPQSNKIQNNVIIFEYNN